MKCAQKIFTDSLKCVLLIKYNEHTPKIRLTRHPKTETCTMAPQNGYSPAFKVLVVSFGELLGFEALSKSNFCGILVLFYQKYMFWRVSEKTLN